MAAVLVAHLPVCAAAASAASAPVFDNVPFETLGIGTQSGCVQPAKLVITDEAEWRRVWSVHTHGLAEAPALPAVDFSQQIVVALIQGKDARGAGAIEVAQVVRGPREVTVSYYVDRDSGAKNGARPFHFAAIPKPATPVRFVDALNVTCTTCGH